MLATMRFLILCTHNSARSQMGEGWLRYHAASLGLPLEIVSAGVRATRVQPEAVQVMAELGIDLTLQTSKALGDLTLGDLALGDLALGELPRPLKFGAVITVSSTAAGAFGDMTELYSPGVVRRHYPFEDPSGGGLDRWRELRRQINVQMQGVAQALASGAPLPPSREYAEPLGAVARAG